MRFRTALCLFAIVALGTSGCTSGPTTAQLPNVAAKAGAGSLERGALSDSRLVTVVGDDSNSLENAITSARLAGKLPLFVNVSGSKGGTNFSPFAPVFRTRRALVVVAYSNAYAFPLSDVEVRYSAHSQPVDVSALPSIDLPKVDRGIARYYRLVAQHSLQRQYRPEALKAKQAACPNCAYFEPLTPHSSFLTQLASLPRTSWQSEVVGVPVWNDGAAHAAQAEVHVAVTNNPPCVSALCNYGFPSEYYGSLCDYDSYTVCGQPKRKPPRNPALEQCLDIAAQLAGQPLNGMVPWQQEYCAYLEGVSATTKAKCYAVGPLPLATKQGFCRSAFG